MQMSTIGGVETPACELAAHDGQSRVPDRNRHQHQRHGDRQLSVGVAAPFQADQPHDQADQRTPRVAQVDRRRRTVETEKADQAADQRRGDGHGMVLAVGLSDHGGRRSSDKPTTEAAIHAVEQVHGIQTAHEPKHRQRNAEIPQVQRVTEYHYLVAPVPGHDDRYHATICKASLRRPARS